MKYSNSSIFIIKSSSYNFNTRDILLKPQIDKLLLSVHQPPTYLSQLQKQLSAGFFVVTSHPVPGNNNISSHNWYNDIISSQNPFLLKLTLNTAINCLDFCSYYVITLNMYVANCTHPANFVLEFILNILTNRMWLVYSVNIFHLCLSTK